MNHAPLPAWRRQQRLGWFLLILFVATLIGLWLAAPVKALFREHVLKDIVYGEGVGFSPGFGALPELVRDRGGSEPVPLAPATPQRAPEYRDADWLRSQDSLNTTLQIAVLSEERSVVDFLSARADRDRFTYFSVPAADGAGHQFILVFGSFAGRAQAEDAASTLLDLPGQPLPRLWGVYQEMLAVAPPASEAAPVVTAPALPTLPAQVPPEP